MKSQLSTFGKHFTRAFSVMAVCGLAWACTDDFKLDDEKPSWLNASIYESLQQGLTDDNGTHHTFNTYLQLLADKDVNLTDSTGEYKVRPLTEVLSRTGSKTVFVAGDDAWEQFFKDNAKLPANNPWHNATSYSNLTPAQKKLLIHTSMLNNAIVMENLASSDGRGTDAPTRGEYMRRFTDVELTDTITYIAPEDLPFAYNIDKEYPEENVYDENGNFIGKKAFVPEKNYWTEFGPKGNNKGIYLVMDSTANMMLHFTAEHMSNNAVRDEDFAIFMGRERATDDVHIYDAKVLAKDKVAENGYVNITEKVLVPRPNLAEMIRTNGNTRIFSHVLERFSFPYLNKAVTQAYNDIHKDKPIEAIYTKHYYSKLGPGKTVQIWDSKGNKFEDSYGEVALKFDPGWNGFYPEDATDERPDMAAMFVPSDQAFWNYFQPGQEGWDLIETYATDQTTMLPKTPESDADYEKLFQKIDDIPLSTIQALVNVIMFPTFTGSVPSKMTKLRDDARDDIFYDDDINGIYDNKLSRDGGHIDTCLLANNGALYIMNKVYSPADFASVAAPAYISKKNLIMKWAIYNGFVESQDRMHINYFAYLKAMKSTFTFFLPSDKAMLNYYDPVSFTSQKPRVLVLDYTGGKNGLPFTKTLWKFNPATAKRDPSLGSNAGDDTYGRTETIGDEEVVNRLKDILESHTIVHDGTNPIYDTDDQYYIAKNGSAIKVIRDPSDRNNIIKVQGGYQLENERYGITDGDPGTLELTVAEKYDKKNGLTLLLNDGPIIPASRSVYGILTEKNEGEETSQFSKFFELTQPSDSMLEASQLVNASLKGDNKTRALLKYYTFVNATSKMGNGGGVDYNVQFFNNYRYTILVPTNEAIQKAIDHGLPTWESIKADYYSLPKYKDICDSIIDLEGEKEYFYVNVATAKDIHGNDSTYNDTIIVSASKLEDYFVQKKDVLRLQAKITFLNNFIRGHFLDNSIFVDKSERSEAEYVTSSYDRDLGVFVKVLCKRVKQGGDTKLVVRDNYGGPELTVTDVNNIMARDIICYRNNKPQTPTNQNTMNNITISGSSFAVIHQIPGVLNHTSLSKGSDGEYVYPDFTSESACKAYLEQFATPNDIQNMKHYER